MSANDKPQEPKAQTAGAATGLIEAVERLGASVHAAGGAIVSRRGMGLAVAGGFLVALAWVGERDSAWGVPTLVVGALMIGLGLLGPRLSGSMALRWGEDGAFFQLTSTVAPPGRRHPAPELTDPEPDEPPRELPDKLIPPTEIEGAAETIDFKVTASQPGDEVPAVDGSQAAHPPTPPAWG